MNSFFNSVEEDYKRLPGCTQLPQCGYVYSELHMSLDKLKTELREFKEEQAQIYEDYETRLRTLEKAILK